MNKSVFCEKVAAKLKEEEARKAVPAERHTFRISDENGNTSKFVVKKSDRTIGYNIDDVKVIVNAGLEVIEDALKAGERVYFQGFGALELKYREGRMIRHPGTGENVEVPGHYVPKFAFGDRLRTCARVFEQFNGNAEDDESSSIMAEYNNTDDIIDDSVGEEDVD